MAITPYYDPATQSYHDANGGVYWGSQYANMAPPLQQQPNPAGTTPPPPAATPSPTTPGGSGTSGMTNLAPGTGTSNAAEAASRPGASGNPTQMPVARQGGIFGRSPMYGEQANTQPAVSTRMPRTPSAPPTQSPTTSPIMGARTPQQGQNWWQRGTQQPQTAGQNQPWWQQNQTAAPQTGRAQGGPSFQGQSMPADTTATQPTNPTTRMQTRNRITS